LSTLHLNSGENLSFIAFLIISDASLFSDSSEVETNHIVGFDLVSSISFCQILDVNIIIEFLKYPVFQSQNVTFHSSKIHKRD
jgi:hypothetical protein